MQVKTYQQFFIYICNEKKKKKTYQQLYSLVRKI